ncbi:MAG: hypothetical protein AB1640_10320 [bacterium]
MQTDGNVIREHWIPSPARLWDEIKDWTRKHATREQVFDAALAAATLGSSGFVLLVLQKAAQSYTMTGF